MSKQFQSKKESLQYINKTYSESSDLNAREERLESLEKKYKELAERTKKLEQVYQFHKGIIQNISSGIITIDFNGEITFINSAALKLVDYHYSEMVGQSVLQLFADEKEGAEILEDITTKKQMYESQEVNLKTRANKIIPIGFTTTLLKDTISTFSGVVISFRDLTNLQNFRLQMERMDRLATLGEVSAGIAHEIRNPLAGIKTSAQVLEESFSPGDHRSQLVARIVKEIDRSNELLRKFFNFAKPGRPRQEPIRIEPTIDGVYMLLSSKMRKKNIEFVRDYASDLPEIYVDENQVEQVLINLFLNGIDAMAKGGQFTAKCDLISVEKSDEKETQYVRLQLSDNGIGINQNNVEKIFNPFFTTKRDGVGLGLSISSRLIEENGGRIEVSSEEGKGTEFQIYLPCQ